jgi:predicted MarR family transcription regulator
MKELLKRIASQVSCMNVEDMTTAEINIAKMLVKAGLLETKEKVKGEVTYEVVK